MTDRNSFIELIVEYEDYIDRGNKILKAHFKTDQSPLIAYRRGIIPMSGKIESENMSFYFHGMGCRFEFKEATVDFDYSFDDFVYIGFEATKLLWFIESLSDINTSINLNEIVTNLNSLEKGGFVVRKDDTSYDTYDYRLITSR